MGFFDSVRDVLRTFSGDDEYEDTPAASAHHDIYAAASAASTAPNYASYASPVQPQEPVNRPSAVPDAIVSAIALLRPENLSSVREAADHLLQNHAVILSFKHTDPNLSRRWLDYLSGTVYMLDGKVSRIAPYTYLLAPKGVAFVSGFDEEQ